MKKQVDKEWTGKTHETASGEGEANWQEKIAGAKVYFNAEGRKAKIPRNGANESGVGKLGNSAQLGNCPRR